MVGLSFATETHTEAFIMIDALDLACLGHLLPRDRPMQVPTFMPSKQIPQPSRA